MRTRPLQQVDKFYDFWFSFKSWREFPHPDEEDIEQAECREEKTVIHSQLSLGSTLQVMRQVQTALYSSVYPGCGLHLTQWHACAPECIASVAWLSHSRLTCQSLHMR